MSEKSGVISEVSKQGGRYQRLVPVIVKFEHGDIDPVSFGELKAGLSYEFPDRRDSLTASTETDPNLKVFVKTNQLTYSNMTRSAREVRPNPYTKTLLAIRNKVTNQVRLVETNCVTVSGEIRHPKSSNPFLIEESLKRKSIKDSDDISAAMSEHRTMSKRHLTREFGQSQGRRMAEQAERMKIDSALKQEKLRNVAENVDESSLFLPEQSKPNELTPPCNKRATRVEDVYKLEDILTSYELDVLEESAKVFMEQFNTPEVIDQAVHDKAITEVFAAVVKRQLQIGDDRIVGAAMYMEAIFQYLLLRPGQISKGPRGLPIYIPFPIKQKVFDMFVPNMLVSQENNDRAFCHALVLAFLTNNYNIDMQRLAASIKIRASLMKKLIMVTGATIRTDMLTRQSFVTLKLPLTKFDPSMSLKKIKKKE